MVLRCSLLGHDYGEADVEREREERGSEVVVTVREYEECARCGTRNVVSENTEVTSLDAPAEPEAVDEPGPEGDAVAESASEGGADAIDEDVTVDEDDAIIVDDEPAEITATSADATAPEADGASLVEDRPAGDGERQTDDVDVPADETGEPIVDDGEILDADAEDDRAHGEWPDSSDVGPPVETDEEPASWPDDDAEEVAPSEPADWPEVDEDAATDAALVDEPAEDGTIEEDPDTGFASAGSAPAPGEGPPQEGVRTELFCPRCSFAAPGDRGSLRPGDICPECRQGYLGEREA